MSEQIHPGHKVLRELVPDEKYRREIVMVMCEASAREEVELTAARAHRILVSHGILETTVEQREQITEFINWI